MKVKLLARRLSNFIAGCRPRRDGLHNVRTCSSSPSQMETPPALCGRVVPPHHCTMHVSRCPPHVTASCAWIGGCPPHRLTCTFPHCIKPWFPWHCKLHCTLPPCPTHWREKGGRAWRCELQAGEWKEVASIRTTEGCRLSYGLAFGQPWIIQSFLLIKVFVFDFFHK